MFKPKPLTVPFVFSRLTDIANSSGKDVRSFFLFKETKTKTTQHVALAFHQSMTKKINIIKQLLTACQGSEAKFVIRSLEGKLRIGLAEKTIIMALAQAVVVVRNCERYHGH